MIQQNEENFDSFREVANRLQERTKLLSKKIKELDDKSSKVETIVKILENKNFDKLCEDLHKLDIRVQAVEIAQGGHDQNWKTIINFAVQVIWVVMAAYILLKLGLQAPI